LHHTTFTFPNPLIQTTLRAVFHKIKLNILIQFHYTTFTPVSLHSR
jgi:hypothetical protein